MSASVTSVAACLEICFLDSSGCWDASGLLLLQLRISLPFLCRNHSVFGLEICSMYLVYRVTCSSLKTVGKDGISRPPNDLERYS